MENGIEREIEEKIIRQKENGEKDMNKKSKIMGGIIVQDKVVATIYAFVFFSSPG